MNIPRNLIFLYVSLIGYIFYSNLYSFILNSIDSFIHSLLNEYSSMKNESSYNNLMNEHL